MRKSNQMIQNFFGKINDDYILNVLYVLSLVLGIKEHKNKLQEILNIYNPNTSLDEFYENVKYEIKHYEGLLKENKKYLMEDIVTGPAISAIKETPAIWCFISLYWAYDFKHKDKISILSVYNPKIGDIALKFLLYIFKMKQKEAHTACVKHEPSFYEDIAPRLVRIIDTLPVMHSQDSSHLNMQYFPTSKSDLALNFLEVQINNHWEQAALYVKSEKPNNTIHYKHDGENLNLTIKPSRMTKDGAFNDLDKTYNQLMQLFNLDLANSTKRYGFKNIIKSSQKKIVLVSTPVIEPLEEELIYDDSPIDPNILSNEDQFEYLGKRKVYRRDMKDLFDQDDNSEDIKEYVTPNAFQQHKQNIAFSSKKSKEGLFLRSNYDIPITEHLKAFITSIDIDNEDKKIYIGFFILNIALGCKIESLLYLLQEKKVGSLQLKNDAITVKVDSSLFAKNYNKLLSKSEDKLTFSLPIAMSVLIVSLKKVFLGKEFNQVDFLKEYKKFIKSSVEHFPKSISIKYKHLYRYLAQYVILNGKDVLTSKFGTASYTQNDTAKLAYTSSRTNAIEHSQLIKNYWHTLNLDTLVCDILEIPNNYSSHVTSISSENYSGTSQSVEIDIAKDFFQILREKIYDCDKDEVLYFNLVTIYTRFAMSLLAGTRPFLESANFDSYDEETALWVISEKAQDIASGTRLVPLCNIMKSILSTYQALLKDRGLKNNFYLIMNSKTITFSTYSAYKFLQNTHNLKDSEILKEYVENVPLNSGRHLFVRKAIDELVNVHNISTYLGHYAAGEEQFGIYSTIDVQDYCNSIKNITTKIAHICGIKEL